MSGSWRRCMSVRDEEFDRDEWYDQGEDTRVARSFRFPSRSSREDVVYDSPGSRRGTPRAPIDGRRGVDRGSNGNRRNYVREWRYDRSSWEKEPSTCSSTRSVMVDRYGGWPTQSQVRELFEIRQRIRELEFEVEFTELKEQFHALESRVYEHNSKDSSKRYGSGRKRPGVSPSIVDDYSICDEEQEESKELDDRGSSDIHVKMQSIQGGVESYFNPLYDEIEDNGASSVSDEHEVSSIFVQDLVRINPLFEEEDVPSSPTISDGFEMFIDEDCGESTWGQESFNSEVEFASDDDQFEHTELEDVEHIWDVEPNDERWEFEDEIHWNEAVSELVESDGGELLEEDTRSPSVESMMESISIRSEQVYNFDDGVELAADEVIQAG